MKLKNILMLSGILCVNSVWATNENIESGQLSSGIIFSNINKNIKPQNDFYDYINGTWISNTQIPADKSSWGSFQILRENTQEQLNTIIQKLVKQKELKENSNSEKVAYLYSSFMNVSQLNSLGYKPIEPMLNSVEDIKSKKNLAGLFAILSKSGVTGPFDIAIHQDAKDSSVVVVDIVQSGLGLPDRDYYIASDDKTLSSMKQEYVKYVADMLKLVKDKNSEIDANTIVEFETKLAQIQWTNVENRDPVKTYNKTKVTELSKLMPDFNWDGYLVNAEIKGKVNYVIVSQPTYLTKLNSLLNEPLATWKLYFKWKIINAYVGYLSDDFEKLNFAFYGTVLSGVPQQQPRYKRGINLVSNNLGFALGELYVKDYFPASSKEQMKQLVDNLIKEYAISIDNLDWMGKKTKKEAKKKLSKMMLKIAYPDTWRDYSELIIKKNDLVGNLIRSIQFEYNRNINKLGKPVDKSEWMMTPQTVNAYYNPEFNEIVFPAAILQAPFFDSHVDNAANYGGIGAVIGHEISHAFDDQGSQYDADGNLHNWWTKKDKENFNKKTAQLVKQYSAYSPLKGYHVNGELTLGENIADNSGLAIAYRAYHLSLNGNKAPILDGLTANERFYSNWAQVWCSKMRDKQVLMYLKTDPHSPAKFRANGTLSNQDAFYTTYDITSDNAMYIAPQKRVHIW